MKRIAILGSTGSIGKSSLEVARHLSLPVVALAANSNIDLLEEQVKEFSPEIVAVYNEQAAVELKKRLPSVYIVAGNSGLEEVAAYEKADFVISAIVGMAGLLPTVAAIKAGKNVGLANKEVLVAAGAIVMQLVEEYKVNLLPIDSEHSAIFQCLQGQDKQALRRIILTASGGPFRNYTEEQLRNVTVEDALKHPTWNMGRKITIDSSTLMNKGLEVIEASWLFGVKPEDIDIVIHPQSIIHSMVEFIDGSLMSQMGVPTMKVPIQYALTYPKRERGYLSLFDFNSHASLEFFQPNKNNFKCLKLAYDSISESGSMPCYMNAANEILVERFLNREISWYDIANKLEELMHGHAVVHNFTLESALAVDAIARSEAERA